MAELIRYKFVDPEDSRVKKIADDLKTNGYQQVVWKLARQMERLTEIDGWEYVHDRDGNRLKFPEQVCRRYGSAEKSRGCLNALC